MMTKINVIKECQGKFPLSIVMLSYNHVNITKKFLQSLYANEFDFNVVWVDNASHDSTMEFLQDFANQYHNFALISNEKNLGVVGGRNQGYEYACSGEKKPEYILFLDNDQIISDTFLSQHFDVLNLGYDIIGVESWQMNSGFVPVHKNEDKSDWYCYVGCGGMLLKREVPEKLGEMFNKNFFCFFEDPFFCFKSHFAGFKIGWNYKAKLVHLGHQTLGNMSEKNKFFSDSYRKFLSHWNRTPVPHLKMCEIPD